MMKYLYFLLMIWSHAEVIKPVHIDSTPHNSFSKARTILFGQIRADFYLISTSAYPKGVVEMIYGQVIDGECKVGKTQLAFENEEKYVQFSYGVKGVKMSHSKSALIPLDKGLYEKIRQSIADHSKTATYCKKNARRFHEPVLDGPIKLESYSYQDGEMHSCLTVDDDYQVILNCISLLIDNESEFINKQAIAGLRKAVESASK
jgi:hypothetical protein